MFLFYVSPNLRLTEAGTGVQDTLSYLLKFFIQVDLKVIEPEKVWQVNSHNDSESFKCFDSFWLPFLPQQWQSFGGKCLTGVFICQEKKTSKNILSISLPCNLTVVAIPPLQKRKVIWGLFCWTWTDSMYFQDFLGKQSGRHSYQILVILHQDLSPLPLSYVVYTSSCMHPLWSPPDQHKEKRQGEIRVQMSHVKLSCVSCFQYFMLLMISGINHILCLTSFWFQSIHFCPEQQIIWFSSFPTISVAICHLLPKRKKFEVILRIKTEWHESASQDAD